MHIHINLGMPQIIYSFQKRADDFCKLIGNYVYYRRRYISHSMAWDMAKNTL